MMSPGNRQDHPKQTQSSGAGNTPPNIILITLDAINYGLFVSNLENLPHMRELKDNSVFFENAFSIGPSTPFSFPGIIGGIYPYHFGIGIDKNIETIDGILKDYGYHTAFINESNSVISPFFGYCKNIDYQQHFLNLSHAEADRKLEDTFLKRRDDKIPEDHWKQAPLIIERLYRKLPSRRIKNCARFLYSIFKFPRFYLTKNTESFQQRRKLYHQFRSEILRFINERFESPQFLWIHTIINHLPYFPPEDSDKFSVREINYLNYRALSGPVTRRLCEKLKLLYIESLKRTDELVGDVIGALRDNDMLDNTILVITSDHGEEFMEEGYFGHEPESSSDGVLRVPLMFHCPSIFRNKSISTPVSTIDIFPTVCDLLGLRVPNTNRGVSLKATLLGESENRGYDQRFRQRAFFSEAWTRGGLLDRKPGHWSQRKIFTVRKGGHKLKVVQQHKGKDKITESLDLVDWVNNERLDVKSSGTVVEELKTLLHRHIHEGEVFAAEIRCKTEKQRIKKALGRLVNRQP